MYPRTGIRTSRVIATPESRSSLIFSPGSPTNSSFSLFRRAISTWVTGTALNGFDGRGSAASSWSFAVRPAITRRARTTSG